MGSHRGRALQFSGFGLTTAWNDFPGALARGGGSARDRNWNRALRPAGKEPPRTRCASPFAVASNESLPPGADTSAVGDAYRDQTSRYLGQAAALLISLPAKDSSSNADATFAGKAADLLVTTRLLMDSPAAQDPKLRSLLEDLEFVLVQVARLRGGKSKEDLDLIHQAVEQGDVLSRLNTAVTTQSSE